MMTKQYTRKQIQEAIKYWQGKLDESANDQISIDLDCNMEKPYRAGMYSGDYTPKQFTAIVNRYAKKCNVEASVKIPGYSSADSTVTVIGLEKNVRQFVADFYNSGMPVSDEDWSAIVDQGGTSGF